VDHPLDHLVESIPKHLQRKCVLSVVVGKVLVARSNCGHVVHQMEIQREKESRYKCRKGPRVGQEACCMEYKSS
jgi:hypothetical protein